MNSEGYFESSSSTGIVSRGHHVFHKSRIKSLEFLLGQQAAPPHTLSKAEREPLVIKQRSPPTSGTGFVQSRDRYCVPFGHLDEHSQEDHVVQFPDENKIN